MIQHNPPHVGQLIKSAYIDPFDDVTVESLAKKIGLSSERFEMLLKGEIGLSIAVAKRLSDVLGRSAESWLKIQEYYNDAQEKSLTPEHTWSYLNLAGWRCNSLTDGNVAIWRITGDFEAVQPLDTGLKDYHQLVHDMLEVLSAFESRPIFEIVIDMKRHDRD